MYLVWILASLASDCTMTVIPSWKLIKIQNAMSASIFLEINFSVQVLAIIPQLLRTSILLIHSVAIFLLNNYKGV